MNKDESAFPHQETNAQTATESISRGMPLRDYFAAKAIQGMLANPNREYDFNGAALDAYEWADALLKVRNPSPTQKNRQGD